MTKAQFTKKVKSMKKDLISYIEKECMRLYDCGGVEPKNYENNYLLPKIVLSVALKNAAFQHEPLSDYRKVSKNLEKF